MDAIIPIPRITVSVREATLADLPFIDALQKKHNKQVAFLKEQALIGKINLKQIIIAEESGQAVGYIIGNDKYFKRENVGVIYQLNVSPGKQRNLVGAQLVKAMFDRAAYGCTLFCLWCAQDLEANHFWESIGFVPLAFRAGSRKKDRVHIFWQKRIREGDTTTQWWYPTETTGGMMNEARLVFPIPPGVHWSDPMPRVLPVAATPASPPALIEDKAKRGRGAHATSKKPPLANLTLGRLQFTRPVEKKEKPKRAGGEKRPKMKNDPALVAKARQLNACWLEEINSNPSALPAPGGKYQVIKQIEQTLSPALSQGEREQTPQAKPTRLLAAA
jgi:N-acetylglutamate synthase-like GNAT family acetyltransferase